MRAAGSHSLLTGRMPAVERASGVAAAKPSGSANCARRQMRMPECRRCRRVQPRCELRATSLGFVCLEHGELGKESRCAKLELDVKHADRAARRTERVRA